MTRAIVVAAFIVGIWLTTCEGQGLEDSPRAVLGASSSQARLEAVYRQSQAFRIAYRNRPSFCSKASGSLCASSGASTEQKAVLEMATSPLAYDARNPQNTGGFKAIGPVKDQGDCNTCVAFVVLSIAQSAMASALKEDATGRISEQDFFFCKAVGDNEDRTCTSSWGMLDGVQTWATLDHNNKYPVMDYCMKYDPSNTDCSTTCRDIDPDLANGYFKWSRVQSGWEVMDQIRTWGSVATRLNVYDDFKPFFKSDPNGVYTGPKKGANFVESHAIQLVGYNLESNPPYWIAKNSWGTSFASGGFFKITQSGSTQTGLCSPDDTFAMRFVLNNPPGKPWNRLSGPVGKNCYMYRGGPGDYMWKVAQTFGLAINDVLADNTARVKEPNEWLNGIQIMLCGLLVPSGVKIGSAAPAPAKPAAAAPAKPDQQKPKGTPWKPVKYNPDQDQPYLGPLYFLTIGTYKGSYKCDGAGGSGMMVLQRDDARNVGQVRIDTTFLQSGRCNYKMVLRCNSVRDGSGTWCGGSEEPWDCDVDSISRWDSCGGQLAAVVLQQHTTAFEVREAEVWQCFRHAQQELDLLLQATDCVQSTRTQMLFSSAQGDTLCISPQQPLTRLALCAFTFTGCLQHRNN